MYMFSECFLLYQEAFVPVRSKSIIILSSSQVSEYFFIYLECSSFLESPFFILWVLCAHFRSS